MDKDIVQRLRRVHARLRSCKACPHVCGTPVHGPPVVTPVLLVGQAPGVYEASRGRPFAHTAGKTLFKWLGQATGNDEEELRELIYFSAVARCFPGKTASGKGDRPPSREEIQACSLHLRDEVRALKPKLILAVGKPAIVEVLASKGVTASTPLAKVVGEKFEAEFHGHTATVIPLPHSSGVSTWPHTEPGKTCLRKALGLIAEEFRRAGV